ncbi:hypothetical protein GQ457_14G002390 [Hibiscus cannabinus]
MSSDNGLEDVQGVSVDNVVHNVTASDNSCVSGADNSNVSKIFCIKKINVVLNDNNYLLWHQQVLLTIKTHRLLKFIDGNVTWPPQYVNKDGVVSINPDYELYEEQDGALASWLLSTVSEEVLPHLIGHNMASEIWNTLHRLYSGKTTSRLMTYRRLLHSQKKCELSMRDYLMKLKYVCDSLASCGEIISEQEHVTAILNGLPPEYDSVITVITDNPTPSDLRTVRTILLDAESRQVSLIDQYPVSAHVVVQQQQQQTSNTPVFTASHAQSVQHAYTNPQQVSEDRLVTMENTGYNTSDSNSGVYRGRGRGRFSSSRPHCQLCVLGSDGAPSDNMVYYSAPVTHHVSQLPPQNQFVPAIAHSTPSASFPSPIGSHVTSVTPGCGQLAQYLPTVVVAGSTMVQQASTPQALIATPEIVDDNAWYPNSGATHHLTKDIGNLQVGSTYPSTSMVQVAGSFPASSFFKQQRYLSPSKSSSRFQVASPPSHLHAIPSTSHPHQSPSPSPHLHAIPSISSLLQSSPPSSHLHATPSDSSPQQLSSPSPHLHAIPSISPPHQSPSPSPHLHAIPSISSPLQSSPPSSHLHATPSDSSPQQLSSPSSHLHAIPSISHPHQVSPPSPQLHDNPSVSPPLQLPSSSQVRLDDKKDDKGNEVLLGNEEPEEC